MQIMPRFIELADVILALSLPNAGLPTRYDSTEVELSRVLDIYVADLYDDVRHAGSD